MPLHLDYAAPLDRMRDKAAELMAQSQVARGTIANVQVINTSPQGIEFRILINADSAANASSLCAELREKLIAFLVREHPEALPHRRVETLPPTPRA